MAIFNLNKTANIEIENDLIKYRVPLIEYETENINEIEKDIKRKVAEIENEGYYLTPFKVEIINSSVIYYYDVVNYKSFLYIRQLDFKEKLKYFASLVEIAKNSDKTKVTWVKENFVLDPFEEKIKAITYETNLIKMREKTNVLEGLKELIIISLTNLDSILGKPRRTNFIDQDDEVISFAETVLLKIDTIDDLDSYIQTKIIEYEYEYEKKHKDIQYHQEEKKKGLFKIPKPKQKKDVTSQYQTKKKSKSGKGFSKKETILYGVLGILLLVGIILNFAMGEPTAESETDKPKENDTELVTETVNSKNNSGIKTNEDVSNEIIEVYGIKKSQYDDKLLTAYRYAMLGDSQKALSVLEEIGFSNLSETDQKIMLSVYEKDGNFVKVIELNPDYAEWIVNNLIAEDKIDKLKEIHEQLETDNPYVSFEIAYIDGDWEKVLEYKDKVRLNGRKETQITESYIKLNRLDEAEEFAELVGNPDLIKMIEQYR